MSKTIGLYKKLTTNPNQKLLHSGQDIGTLTNGINATLFRTIWNISEKLYIYATDIDNNK